MIKTTLLLISFIVINTIFSQKLVKYYDLIDSNKIRVHTTVLASDSLEGRNMGDLGQKKAASYIQNEFRSLGLDSLSTNYYQTFNLNTIKKRGKLAFDSNGSSENVLAFIPGSDKKLKNEFVVVSAHYDHLGKDKKGNVYNGADDNASGTATLLELARIFKEAEKEGVNPKRSILFICFTGEEHGLIGSSYFSKNPLVPMKQIVADFNIDMIGRKNEPLERDSLSIYIIGSDKISLEFHKIHEKVARDFGKLKLDYTYNADSHPEKLYYRSDHYNFAKNGIPSVFYFGGFHEDYHEITDDVEKLNFTKIKTIAELIFLEINEFGN